MSLDEGARTPLGNTARVPVAELRQFPGNPRRGDVDAIAASLQRLGQYRPIVVRRATNEVLAGNHTLQAAVRLGWAEIDVTYVDADEQQARAIVAADNRLADLGSYDDEDLAALLRSIDDADLRLTAGYTEEDLAELLASLDPPQETPPPTTPIVVPSEPVTQRGDVWQLGPHRVMCGDCRDPSDVATLLAGAVVNLAVTSPPYAEQREYDEASGFVPIKPAAYVEWFAPVAGLVAAHLADDGSWLVNIKPPGHDLDTDLYVLDLVTAHVRSWGWHFATEFCWERPGIPGKPARRLKNEFEPVFQFARGEWKFRPAAVMEESARAFVYEADKGRSLPSHQGNVDEAWFDGHDSIGDGLAYPGNRLPSFAGTHEATGHKAAFPVGLPAFLTRLFTDEGDAIYDPFCGSGSTILAADQEGRVGYGMEISPGYVDVIVARWERHTGQTATRVGTSAA